MGAPWDYLPPGTTLALGLALLSLVVLRAYQIYVAKPWGIIKKLKSQGVPGYPYLFYFGQIKELIQSYDSRDRDPALASRTCGSHFWAEAVRELGPTFFYTLGPMVCLATADPDFARSALVANTWVFEKQEYAKRGMSILGNGLLLAEGEHWRWQKRLINPALSLKAIRALIPTMLQSTKEAIERWGALSSEKGGERGRKEPLYMEREFPKLAMDVVFKSVFGTELERVLSEKESEELLSSLFTHFDNVFRAENFNFVLVGYRYLPTALNRLVWSTRRKIVGYMRRIVSDRVARYKQRHTQQGETPRNPISEQIPKTPDLLGMMIDATDLPEEETRASPVQSPEKDKRDREERVREEAAPKGAVKGAGEVLMSVQELMDNCCTFFTAGSETTATLLTWTMLLLSQHREWQVRAREEVRSFCPDEGQTWSPTFEELNEMKVLGNILNEAMRLYPPIPMITRTCTKDTLVSDSVVVPKGTDIYVLIELIHRSKELWGEDAEEFKPDRFKDSVGKASLHPGAFMPFGLGPRSCIGQVFAMTEAKIILGALLHKFSWEIDACYKHHPEAMIALRPKQGMPVLFTKLV